MKRVLSFKFLVVSFLLPLLAMLTSCDVHQWPEPNNEPAPEQPSKPDQPNNPDKPNNPDNPNNPEDPDNPDNPDDPTDPDNPDGPPFDPGTEEKTTLNLSLQYLTDFSYRDYTYDSKTGAVKAASQGDGDTYDNLERIAPGTPMKVTVKVHLDNPQKTFVSSHTFVTELDNNYDCKAEIVVPTGYDYLITAWGHLLDEKGNAFYNEADFNSIELVRSTYRGNTDLRDAFRGRLKLSVPEEGEIRDIIPMRRPMCKLEFVTTGLQEFFANEEKRQSIGSRAVSPDDYTVVVSYPAYYPSHYMAMEDRLEFASQGYNFTTPITLSADNADETSMGFDYVLINDTSDAAVQVQVTVLHRDGTQLASTGMLTVPMFRDRHVVVRGNFLTTNGSGGVGIDPDFEGDFNIPIY